MRAAVLFGAMLVAVATLWAQSGTVRIRVTDTHGAAIAGATVSLMDSRNRTLQTLPTNTASEVIWKNLPHGDWYFDVSAAGFYSHRAAIAICDSHEQTIAAQLKPAPAPRPEEQFRVYGPAPLLNVLQMPYCQILDQPAKSK
jgi:hypothetical protein